MIRSRESLRGARPPDLTALPGEGCGIRWETATFSHLPQKYYKESLYEPLSNLTWNIVKGDFLNWEPFEDIKHKKSYNSCLRDIIKVEDNDKSIIQRE